MADADTQNTFNLFILIKFDHVYVSIPVNIIINFNGNIRDD